MFVQGIPTIDNSSEISELTAIRAEPRTTLQHIDWAALYQKFLKTLR
jgi:hypothetical protein